MRVEVIRELTKLPNLNTLPAVGLQAFFGHDEPMLIAAFEKDECRGYLPLKRVIDHPLGMNAVKLTRASGLHGHVDESSALPMLEYLLANEQFSLLELGVESDSNALARFAPRFESFKYGVQCVAGPVRATVALGRDVDTWFHGLQGWAAPLARRTRSLMSSGEVELLSCSDPRAGKELLTMYMELEARSYKLDSCTGIGGDARRAALHAALAEGGTLFHFLMLDGLPIAATLSLQLGERIVQLEGVCDMSFEDTAPEEVLLMLEVRDAINRGAVALELCPDLVPHHARLGAAAAETCVVQIYRRFGPHHLDAMWRGVAGEEQAIPMHAGPMRSDLARQLRARTHATEALDRLDSSGVSIDRLWGDQLRACLPFEVQPAEHEAVRRLAV